MMKGLKELCKEDLANLIRQGFNYFIVYKQQSLPHGSFFPEIYEMVPVKRKTEADAIFAFMGEKECVIQSVSQDLDYLFLASSGALNERYFIPI